MDQYIEESDLGEMMCLSKPIKYDELKRMIEKIEARVEDK